ncbi:hypothetical protein QAD02_016173 [Eretmocerus hayati]|uniref:Uncharacterized protein n=1 Tax=Eretmocerus hayati TaxID=131215 RepID=A0ACC2PBM4_9HYME|nr:hypothetical protein QAD02_016173 [Eretmocerus hayati]
MAPQRGQMSEACGVERIPPPTSMNKGQRRMTNFNRDHYEQQPVGDWSDPVYTPQNPVIPRSNQRGPNARSNNWNRNSKAGKEPKGKGPIQPKPVTDQSEAIPKAKTETLIDEPLWQSGPYSGKKKKKKK